MANFVTAADAALMIPQWSQYTLAEQTNALEIGNSLTLSYLDNKLVIPTGTTPAILKTASLHFTQYTLEYGSVGITDELILLYNNTVDMLRGTTQSDLDIPVIGIGIKQVGWSAQIITASGLGYFFLDPNNAPPRYDLQYTFTITSSGLNYVAGTTFDLTRFDSATLLEYNTQATTIWQYHSDSMATFAFRWAGRFSEGDTVIITGVPISSITETPDINKTIQQRPLVYGD
jgi:phage gp36-like protein